MRQRPGLTSLELLISVALGGALALGASSMAFREVDGRATNQESLAVQQAVAGLLATFSKDVRAGSGLMFATATECRIRHAAVDGAMTYVSYRLDKGVLQRGVSASNAQPVAWSDLFDAANFEATGTFTYFLMGNISATATSNMRRIELANFNLKVKRTNAVVAAPSISAVMRESGNARDLVSSCEVEVVSSAMGGGGCGGAGRKPSKHTHTYNDRGECDREDDNDRDECDGDGGGQDDGHDGDNDDHGDGHDNDQACNDGEHDDGHDDDHDGHDDDGSGGHDDDGSGGHDDDHDGHDDGHDDDHDGHDDDGSGGSGDCNPGGGTGGSGGGSSGGSGGGAGDSNGGNNPGGPTTRVQLCAKNISASAIVLNGFGADWGPAAASNAIITKVWIGGGNPVWHKDSLGHPTGGVPKTFVRTVTIPAGASVDIQLDFKGVASADVRNLAVKLFATSDGERDTPYLITATVP